MKIFTALYLSIVVCSIAAAQPSHSICVTDNFAPNQPKASRSINDKKVIRINYHFMLKTNGTGNFRETDDGDGRTTYNGYMLANDITGWANYACSVNPQMNIPTGNTTAALPKNYSFVTDAVYFWRNDATYVFNNINYSTQGKDKDSVLNIFLTFATDSHSNGDATMRGYASNLDPMSKVKYTENRGAWQRYKWHINQGYPFDWYMHGAGVQISHELGHLLGLSHTVLWNHGVPCPTGCPGYGTINTACDDGCGDTPTAWEIMSANGCSKHPSCGWGTGGDANCSNNLMDYNGSITLSPCQIGIVHFCLEIGMKSYLSCAAVSKDLALCDIGYPKLSYFGKNVSIGCAAIKADITNGEKINLYFSGSVELNNFEVSSNSTFEVVKEGICAF